MLEVKNIKKSFDQVQALDGVSLKIDKGDVISIIGPSGSGKTTLLRCMNFLTTPDEGEMIFDGTNYDLKKISKKQIAEIRRKTGFVFQNYNLFLNKTVLENVTEGLIVARKMNKAEANEIGMNMLAKVGMADKKDSYPIQLSGGQQQRTAIARALALNPEIIFFDEPTSALDPELIGEVLDVMKSLAKDGMTMLVVTHEMNFAKDVANKTIFMDGGKVIEVNDSKTFFKNPQTDRAKQFLKMITEK